MLAILIVVSFTSCNDDLRGVSDVDGLQTDEPEPEPLTYSSVSATNCADGTLELNCFISVWNTANVKLSVGTSETIQVRIPLHYTGEYDFYVDWGDGSEVQHITAFNSENKTHTYIESGEYTTHIAGKINGWQFYSSRGNFGDAFKILDIKRWGSLSFGKNMGNQFRQAINFNPTALDAPDLSETEDLSYAFYSAEKFSAPMNNWDVSNVNTMVFTFKEASAFNAPLNAWKVGNVEEMGYMFYESEAFD